MRSSTEFFIENYKNDCSLYNDRKLCKDGRDIKGQHIDHTRIYLKQIAKMGEFSQRYQNSVNRTTSLMQHKWLMMSHAYYMQHITVHNALLIKQYFYNTWAVKYAIQVIVMLVTFWSHLHVNLFIKTEFPKQ